jgi:hypothetical protein
VLRLDSPAQLKQGIEDNLRSLAVDHLAAVNLRLMDEVRQNPPGPFAGSPKAKWTLALTLAVLASAESNPSRIATGR